MEWAGWEAGVDVAPFAPLCQQHFFFFFAAVVVAVVAVVAAAVIVSVQSILLLLLPLELLIYVHIGSVINCGTDELH